jgi:hypothetical protein
MNARSTSERATTELDRLLARKRELVSKEASVPGFERRLKELRQWQAARLARTYGDLRENARYAAAVEFFLSDLYGERDFAARDREMERAWRYLKRSLPEAPLTALAHAIELDVLTAELDHAMVKVLPATGPLNESLYWQAYRKVGQRKSRERQIELVVDAGEHLQRAVRHRWVGPLLAASRAPAHAAGFGVLQDFIERGYRAFRRLSDADEFLALIRERETALMQALFSGAGNPFERGAQGTSK